MLRVAIVGCGKIADSHAAQIQRIDGCELVGVCDREALMAKQLHERFKSHAYFDDLDRLLSEAKPDVVHITTPPESHFNIARICLSRGSHVYVEKPFTLYARDAETLIALAERNNRKVTVGHDDQFSHAARRVRRLIDTGYLGGAPVHMESYYCYDIGDARSARATFGDEQHWVRRLPGQLLHNLISHGLARIAEFLTTDTPTVIAHGFASPLLKTISGDAVVDELRVIVSENDRTTAYFTFSSQMRPLLHQFRIYGPSNSIALDQDSETALRLRGGRFKSFSEKFLPQVVFAQQHLANLVANVERFVARDFHTQSGMKYLIESFYRSIVEDTPVPIPYREIVLIARMMDDIFDQLRSRDGLEQPHRQQVGCSA